MSTESTHTGRSLMRTAITAIATIVGAIALTLAMAIPANATINSVTPNPVTSGNSITVEGTAPEDATHYALAICRASNPGTKCSHRDGSYTSVTPVDDPNPPGAGDYINTDVIAYRYWWNYTFVPPMGYVGGWTGCEDSNDVGVPCVVVASYYEQVGMAFVPIGAPATYPIEIDS